MTIWKDANIASIINEAAESARKTKTLLQFKD